LGKCNFCPHKMKSYQDITTSILSSLRSLKVYIPNVLETTYELSKTSMAAGALDQKTKELIAFAIGVANRCDGCLGFHARALVKLGATEQEVSEALGVAIQMGGGPSLMTAADAFNAYLEFKQKAENDVK
jgi:AhpD family alkylhydroperoxidase